MNKTLIALFVILICLFLQPSTAFAAGLDVTVGMDALKYKLGDNITVSGYVRYSTNSRPVSGAIVSISIDGTSIGTVTTDANGAYKSTPVPVGSPGTHTILVGAQKATSTGTVYGSYIVEEYEKQYIVTTDKFIYSPGETVSINVSVSYVLSNGSTIKAPGVGLTLKIKTKNGTIAKEPTSLVTNSNGVATTSYTIPSGGYDDYIIVVDNGAAFAVFKVPPFSVKTNTLDGNGKERFMYGTSDTLAVRVTVTFQTANTTQILPVTNADIVAFLKDSEGNTKTTFTNFTESSAGGIYTSNTYSLENLTNGDYYVEVEVTKGGRTQKDKVWFKIESLRVDLVPFSEKEHVIGFLRNQNVSLGIFAMNLLTGEEISGEQITNATIIECRDSKWKNCMSKLTSNGTLESGFFEFAKVLKFPAPNETGEFLIKVEVNTTIGSGIGEAYISVQNIITYAETKDEFDSWRWDFRPGEKVKIIGYAYGGNWEVKNITSVEVVEIRNKNWTDITSTIDVSVSDNAVELNAPSSPGFYFVKLKITTSEGDVGYAGSGFQVRLYKIWVETVDGPGNTAGWKWKFGSNDNLYLRVNVFDLNDNRVSASNLKVSLNALMNEMTRKRYSGLRVTELPADDVGRLGLQVSLNGSGVTSGFYTAEIEVIDTDGNTDYGWSWFKISNLDVSVETKDTSGGWKWSFSPSENITFQINAAYFNGTSVPDGSNASIEDLLMMREGPPISVSRDVYNKSSTVSLTGGSGTLWIKAAKGKTLPQGNYQAIIKIVTPDGLIDRQEAWFDVRVMNVWSYADPSSVSPNDNVTIRISATKTDGTPIENATCELYKIRNSMTWSEVALPESSPSSTSSDGSAIVTFPAAGLNGEYEAVIKVTSDELGAVSETYSWFSVKKYKITGWLVDESKDVFSPGGTVEMWVKLEYPNSTWTNPQYITGANVTIYKFANTEHWPWSYVTKVNMLQAGTTDSTGKALIKFKAPNDAGRYNPMAQINLSGNVYNSTSVWELREFQVRSASVTVTLYDNTTGEMISTNKFGTNKTITVEINVSNPAGGEVNISSIALKYKNINTQEETTLQTLSYGLGDNNYAYFSSPTTQGDYVLYVTVTDGSTGRPLPAEKRWFKVQSFDTRFWTEKWSYNTGENVTIYLDVIDPAGNPVNVTVNMTEARDAWTWSPVSITGEGAKNIFGQGTYIVTAPSTLGEYEIVLCVYEQGGSCTDSSQRLYIHFAVESFRVDTWPEKPSYTISEDVVLNVEVRSGDSIVTPNNYNVTWVELRDVLTRSDKGSLITTPTEANGKIANSGDRKTITFSAANLSTGEYQAKINVTYGSESRIRDIWFKISDAEITIRTIPQVDGHNRDRWFTGENIQLNISINPPQDAVGTLELKDDYGWVTISTYDLTLTGGSTLFNFSINTSGRYVVIVKIGNADAFYWFEVGAYKIEIKHWLTEHELKPDENVSVIFDIIEPDGTPYEGEFNVTVVSLRNSWDWSTVSQNLFSASMIASNASDEEFNFSHGVNSGEYDAEIRFDIGNKTQTEFFWFMVKSNIFEVRTDKQSYAPGEIVNVDTFFAYPDRTPISGVNITIEAVMSKTDWTDVPVTYINRSMLTDSSGNARLNFTLTNKTGRMVIKLKGNKTQVAYIDIDVNGYNAWVERPNNKWSYKPGEIFTGILYVYDRNNNPLPNRTVNIKVRNEFWNFVESVDINGKTGSNGNFTINFELDAGNFTPGHYMLEANIDNGVAIVTDVWFKVETFNTKVEVMKEEQSTGSLVHEDRFTQNDTVVVRIEVLDENWNIIPTEVNATLMEIRDNRDWTDVTSDVQPIPDTSSPTLGIANIKFKPENLSTGEYIVRINVTANVSGVVGSNVVDAWFRVSPYDVSIIFQCPEGSTERCDPRKTTSGGELIVNVTVSGNYSSFIVCLDRVRNLYTGVETYYSGKCTQNSSPIIFNAPTEQADYDAIFTITIDNQPYGDMVEWFRVGSEYEMNVWLEPWNIWAGENATVWVEIWGPGWVDINESTCSFNLTELRDVRTWEIINPDMNEWMMGPSDSFGPPGYRIGCNIPSDLAHGEYAIKVVANCNGSIMSRDMWFRVVIFQVATLLNERLTANQSAKLWIKVMSRAGGPIQGANITLNKLRDEWTQTVVQTYDWSSLTDVNGEVVIPFTAPSQNGHYVLISTINYNGSQQQVTRWFEIKSLDVQIIPSAEKFYEGENITIYVNVTDPMNNSAPVPNAEVHLNLHVFCKNPEECMDVGLMRQSFTNESGIAMFSINTTENNLTSGDMEVHADVNTPDKGWAWGMKTIVLRRYNINVSGTSIDYNAGDNVVFNVTIKYPNGTALPDTTFIEAGIEKMSIKGEGATSLDKNTTFLNNGVATFNLTIPSNASSGPIMIYVSVLSNSSEGVDIVDEETFMSIVHGTGSSITFVNLNGSGVAGGEFIDVDITTDNSSLAMAPFMMHLEKTGEAVPESQMMSGGPESGKMSWYENKIFFNETGFTHIKILARKQSGNYLILVPFIEKSGDWMGSENFHEIGTMEYKVN
jgi:hypothetical protein